MTQHPTSLRLVASAALLSLLAACGGGGGDDDTSSTQVSDESVQTMTANSAVMSEEGTEAASTVLTTTQAVVAGGQASQTFNCAGGGTALFTATGTGTGLGNGVLDTGEVYSLSYTACRGSAGAAALDGTATLTVTSATAGAIVVNTVTQGLVVTLPQRTLTLDGSSTLSQTVVTNGAATTTTGRWTSPRIMLTSQRNSRSSSFTLSDVDLSRSITTTSGVVTVRSVSGTQTMNAVLPNASWGITTSTQAAVNYDVNGVPTQGSWTMTLPNNRIAVSVVPGTLMATVDYGADGTVDRSFTFVAPTLVDSAG